MRFAYFKHAKSFNSNCITIDMNGLVEDPSLDEFLQRKHLIFGEDKVVHYNCLGVNVANDVSLFLAIDRDKAIRLVRDLLHYLIINQLILLKQEPFLHWHHDFSKMPILLVHDLIDELNLQLLHKILHHHICTFFSSFTNVKKSLLRILSSCSAPRSLSSPRAIG